MAFCTVPLSSGLIVPRVTIGRVTPFILLYGREIISLRTDDSFLGEDRKDVPTAAATLTKSLNHNSREQQEVTAASERMVDKMDELIKSNREMVKRQESLNKTCRELFEEVKGLTRAICVSPDRGLKKSLVLVQRRSRRLT